MLRIVLCDDDPQVLSQYAAQIEKIAETHRLQVHVTCYSSAEKMFFGLDQLLNQVDIFYLDVQMPGISGIEAAKKLRSRGCRAQIIFLTQVREYVFESFDAMPLQYLIKSSCTDEKFEQVFLHAAELAGQNTGELFNCERGSECLAIPVRDIAYFEIAKRIITVHYEGGTFEFYSSMEDLEARLLSKGFVRVHRAFLVNLARIRRMGQESIGLTGGYEVPLGRTYAKRVRELFSHYLAAGGQTFS